MTFNGHIGRKGLHPGVTENYGVGTQNEGDDRILAFATARSMALVNTYFQMRFTRQVTYKSGGDMYKWFTLCIGGRN